MGKGPLNNVATKDKGKTAITAIKYSAPDMTILFSFYNHPQPLWVWADKTCICPKKQNLHVDVWERGNASIKGGGNRQRKGGKWSPGPLNPKVKRIIRTTSSSDEVQGPEPLRLCRGESLLRYARFISMQSSRTPWLTTVQ